MFSHSGLAAAISFAAVSASAFDADLIGFAALRREYPSLTGAGIPVGHPEAEFHMGRNNWQVNAAEVGHPVSLFTWESDSGTTNDFPNAVGQESPHANLVGLYFYGASAGMAPGVQHVRNYEADYYILDIVTLRSSRPDIVINQSFISEVSTELDTTFDGYAAMYNVLFVSGVANDTGTPPAPASCYNGIAVGSIAGTSSIGPTVDGRAKPDIVAPENFTSYGTPLVAGAATLLWQAAARNDGGTATAPVATNASTIKALLLNGAVKPPGWTNGPTRPLDARFGAGLLNAYHSYLQLRGGRTSYSAANSVSTGAAHPPIGGSHNAPAARGWDFNTISSSVLNDRIHHYHFDLPARDGAFTGTATLVWKRPALGSLKNLDLFLYDMGTSNLVASSVSAVDNVEHIFLPNLPPGRYDLQVLLKGGIAQFGSESYALAFDFASSKLDVARAAGGVTICWPINQAGFVLQSAAALEAAIEWRPVPVGPFMTNGFNVITLPAEPGERYFRLAAP